MTERNDTDETSERERTTMRDVDHTHPYDDTSAGELFRRGPTVAADGGERERSERDPRRAASRPDGGERDAASRSSSSSEPRSDGGGDPSREPEGVDEDADADPESPATMRDVDHTPADGDGANRVFERGEEHGTEPVVGEE